MLRNVGCSAADLGHGSCQLPAAHVLGRVCNRAVGDARPQLGQEPVRLVEKAAQGLGFGHKGSPLNEGAQVGCQQRRACVTLAGRRFQAAQNDRLEFRTHGRDHLRRLAEGAAQNGGDHGERVFA